MVKSNRPMDLSCGLEGMPITGAETYSADTAKAVPLFQVVRLSM